MISYHGTTQENADRILNGSPKHTAGITWDVSDDNYLYLWCPDQLVECGEDPEYANEQAIQHAIGSGEMTAVVCGNPQSKIVVLCFDFPENEVLQDYSLDNMTEARSIQLDDYKKYHIKTLESYRDPRIDILILSRICNREYLNLGNIPSSVLDLAKEIEFTGGDPLYEDKDYIETYTAIAI